MKVLYVGVYRDGTGWSHAAIDYILSMDSVGIDVVCRPIKLNSVDAEIPERIKELEAKSSKGCDIVIQHVLPHMSNYDGRFKKNIILYATETSNFINTTWATKINCMDEAWVISGQSKAASRASGVKVPIFKINHAINTSKFLQNIEPLGFEQLKDTFVFYFIGEPTRRKNLAALIKAFHTEFDNSEPVSLMIKCGSDSSQEATKKVADYIAEIKDGLKLYANREGYKKDLIITGHFNEMEMLRLHATGNCFVMPSYGEAWNIPASEALAIGNTPIVTKSTGMDEYITNNNGYLVDSIEEPCFGVMDTFTDIYTAKEKWRSISVNHLMENMRRAYSNREERIKKSEQGIADAYNFSYLNIGNKIKQRLMEE